MDIWLKRSPHCMEADLYAWVTRYEMELRQIYDARSRDDRASDDGWLNKERETDD